MIVQFPIQSNKMKNYWRVLLDKLDMPMAKVALGSLSKNFSTDN